MHLGADSQRKVAFWNRFSNLNVVCLYVASPWAVLNCSNSSSTLKTFTVLQYVLLRRRDFKNVAVFKALLELCGQPFFSKSLDFGIFLLFTFFGFSFLKLKKNFGTS